MPTRFPLPGRLATLDADHGELEDLQAWAAKLPPAEYGNGQQGAAKQK